MIPMLDEAYRTVNEVYVQPRIRHLKARLVLGVITGTILALFVLLAIVCLFLMVFLGLARAYDPQTAATMLFGFCILVCLGTLIIHTVLKRAVDRREKQVPFALPVRKPSNPGSKAKEAGPDMRVMLQEYFADNKMSALAAVAVAGLLIGAKPKLALKTVSWTVRRKAKKRLRQSLHK